MGLALDEPNTEDIQSTINGIGLLYEKKLTQFVEGQVIDFIDNAHGKGLIIASESGSPC